MGEWWYFGYNWQCLGATPGLLGVTSQCQGLTGGQLICKTIIMGARLPLVLYKLVWRDDWPKILRLNIERFSFLSRDLTFVICISFKFVWHISKIYFNQTKKFWFTQITSLWIVIFLVKRKGMIVCFKIDFPEKVRSLLSGHLFEAWFCFVLMQ